MLAWPQGQYLRFALCTGIIVFLAQAAWVLAPAMTQAVSGGKAREAAARSAFIRGDLWTRALIEASPYQGSIDLRGFLAAQAVHVAPVNAAAWLYLAKSAASDRRREKHDAFLKLAFLTGPNDTGVMGPRLDEALTSSALGDEEIQLFVGHDLRLALTHLPQLKTIVIKAYSATTPQNRTQIKALLRNIDPAFAAGLVP